jgi:hypothetical protein
MSRLRNRWTAALILAAGLASVGGCANMFAWFVAVASPPKKIEPLYELPKDKKILVFVDDRPAPVSYETVKYELAARVSRKLVDQKLVKETIPYDRIVDLSMSKDYGRLSITEVGQRLGAEVVVYVQIDSFSLRDTPYSPLWKGKLATQVWVVDPMKPERLWPKDVPDKHGYLVPPVEFKHTENPSPTFGEEIARSLTEEMADKIIDLFHEHVEDEASRLGEPEKLRMDD